MAVSKNNIKRALDNRKKIRDYVWHNFNINRSLTTTKELSEHLSLGRMNTGIHVKRMVADGEIVRIGHILLPAEALSELPYKEFHDVYRQVIRGSGSNRATALRIWESFNDEAVMEKVILAIGALVDRQLTMKEVTWYAKKFAERLSRKKASSVKSYQ